MKIFESNEKEKFLSFEKKYDHLYELAKSKIFKKNSLSPPNKKKIKIINKIELVIKTSKYSNYYRDLLKVIKDLDALTPIQFKILKNISNKNYDKKIRDIQELIPHKLLKNLINTYNEIQLKKDALIITEQIND